jgi:hypothetical protein
MHDGKPSSVTGKSRKIIRTIIELAQQKTNNIAQRRH